MNWNIAAPLAEGTFAPIRAPAPLELPDLPEPPLVGGWRRCWWQAAAGGENDADNADDADDDGVCCRNEARARWQMGDRRRAHGTNEVYELSACVHESLSDASGAGASFQFRPPPAPTSARADTASTLDHSGKQTGKLHHGSSGGGSWLCSPPATMMN